MVKLIKIYFIPLISIILLIIGFVEVNIINTESLSPLGTTEDNFKVVSDEFGEDFQEFIMDKSPIKIYVGEKNDGMATVKFYNKYINLTNNNFIMNFIKNLATYTNKAYINIRDKISGITKNNKENSNYKESDFDKNINEFIKNNSK
ncbi:hypothetical protein [uncultured Clostridium sp.]|uniref:hypothetical protein n=1 Tax=uncultured Clostridium sp. TaxID=59620 RepID=UPI0025CCE625|nr:hypothetical protein [uncultured Clostridium sp.]